MSRSGQLGLTLNMHLFFVTNQEKDYTRVYIKI